MTTEAIEQWSEYLKEMRKAMSAADLAAAEKVLLQVQEFGYACATHRAVLILRAREMHDAADAVEQLDV